MPPSLTQTPPGLSLSHPNTQALKPPSSLRAPLTASIALLCLSLMASPGADTPAPPPASAPLPTSQPSPAPNVPTVPTVPSPSIPQLTSFALPDQFGKVHALDFPRSRPLLLVVGDRRGVAQVDSWIPSLRQHWGDQTDIVGVADVHGIPRLFRDRIADAIRKSHPRPVLLDFEGDLVEPLQCTAREANVFVIDPKGFPIARVTGPTNDTNLATLRAALQPWTHP